MNDRNNVINQIQDGLGSEGSRELAEKIFDALRADGTIYWDDYQGLVLPADVDLIAAAEAALRDE